MRPEAAGPLGVGMDPALAQRLGHLGGTGFSPARPIGHTCGPGRAAGGGAVRGLMASTTKQAIRARWTPA